MFLVLPENLGATESELNRMISLISHITKILLRAIVMRVRNKIKLEIAEDKCGVVEEKGTTNAI